MLPNKTNPARRWALVLLTLALAFSLAACGKKDGAAKGAAPNAGATGTSGNKAEVIATYKDNGQITRGDFDSFVNINTLLNPQIASFSSDPGFQQDMLKQLIAMKILASRADDKVKADADKQTASQLDQFKAYFGAMEGGLDKQLKDHNLTIADVESFLKMSSYGINGLKGKVTDDELKKKYDDNLKADPHAYDVATVSHILVALKDPSDPTGQKDLRTKDQALARAKEVKSKLDAGGDFAALAKEYSDDPGSKDQGGQYKDADINQWVPEFKNAAATLPIGKISDPVETQYGYHVMRVDARKTKSFDEVKESLKNDIAQQEAYDFMDKELPGLILTNKLPQPKPADQTKPGAQTPSAPAPSGK
ncbi:peptidylprolyl isomerase [Gordoniibacillus kamchatkensis]|uniref:Peptidylprolyl isomerase n=1 Tax=Gordoniibacillus kamchatkensis TaxID=1590651 RepID=A0ABR5AFQ9_9BACL|nr:peptidylprolyl isomerase [Paenibacillus sp. VKM B-2647]KIL39400.1 peptidylprolyl isomerase [Paenibacillus sp. VKM B-2647]